MTEWDSKPLSEAQLTVRMSTAQAGGALTVFLGPAPEGTQLESQKSSDTTAASPWQAWQDPFRSGKLAGALPCQAERVEETHTQGPTGAGPDLTSESGPCFHRCGKVQGSIRRTFQSTP